MITDLKAAMAAKIPKEQVQPPGSPRALASCRRWGGLGAAAAASQEPLEPAPST